MPENRPALFLDRDGVINVDHAYVHRQEHFEFIDGIFDLCRLAKKLGFAIFVVTNQAGIGRGYYSEEDFRRLTEWMCGIFTSEGICIDKVYYCPFHQEHGIGDYKIDSPLRKPNPGMILQAIEEFNIDPTRSILVGDRATDIQAGTTAGVRYNILLDPNSPNNPPLESIAGSLRDLPAVKVFLSKLFNDAPDTNK